MLKVNISLGWVGNKADLDAEKRKEFLPSFFQPDYTD
jgi:hypothetical protein